MVIEWKNPENIERLLAALYIYLSETNVKIDYTQIAEIFGQDATYWAIEYGFRKVKKQAEEIRAEGTFETSISTTIGGTPVTPKKTKTPKKGVPASTSGILSGRVSKPPTASKQRITTVKLEQEFNSPTPPSPREPSADAGLRSPSSGNLHKKAFHKSPASSSNMGFEHINMQYFGQLEDADFYGQEV